MSFAWEDLAQLLAVILVEAVVLLGLPASIPSLVWFYTRGE
jgi:hypothetical protein